VADIREMVLTRGRPLPQPTVGNAAFYEATLRNELRLQRCIDCDAWRHYPRPVCPQCLSVQYRWDLASGKGRIYTWTIVHGPTLPAFEAELPYNVVDVLLDEGIHFQSQLLDCPPDEICADLRVRAVFVPVSDDITLVKFVRETEESTLNVAGR
jgi:uncharacterized OB-fold protein